MNLLAALGFRKPAQPPPQVIRRYVVSTKADDEKARRLRHEVLVQLAVYNAVTPLEQRRAETEDFIAKARAEAAEKLAVRLGKKL